MSTGYKSCCLRWDTSTSTEHGTAYFEGSYCLVITVRYEGKVFTRILQKPWNIENLVDHYQNEEVTSLLDLALILDPRFKGKYVRNVDDVLARVKEEGANFVWEFQEQWATQNFSTSSSSDSADNVITLEPSRKKWKLGTLFSMMMTMKKALNWYLLSKYSMQNLIAICQLQN